LRVNEDSGRVAEIMQHFEDHRHHFTVGVVDRKSVDAAVCP
jgi:hypothetical protein